jgi:arylformamidase
MILVIMGAAGAGKTTVGLRLAAALGWPFHDADDYHPAANVARIAAGVALTDDDRAPWLASMAALLHRLDAAGRPAVVACSALKQSYRDLLAGAARDVRFVYLRAGAPELRRRLEDRLGHFAGASILNSQLATLEEPSFALTVDASLAPDQIVRTIERALGLDDDRGRPAPDRAAPMPRIHDISLDIADDSVIYPGNPEIRITLQQAIARGDAANVSSLAFGSHTGTHVDAPRHFVDGAMPVDRIPLERLIGPAVVRAFGDEVSAIGEAELRAQELRGHTRVLLRTRNSALLARGQFQRDYAYLAPDGAEYLLSLGVELVGIDYLSIEQFRSGHHRTHLALLRRDVVILEGLSLGGVAPGEYDLICLPLKLRGLDGAPARAVLVERHP